MTTTKVPRAQNDIFSQTNNFSNIFVHSILVMAQNWFVLLATKLFRSAFHIADKDGIPKVVQNTYIQSNIK